MKRVITIVQRKGMEGVLSHTARAKRRAPDCAYCKHSTCAYVNGVWAFVCALRAVASAIGCSDFRDAREPLAANWAKVQ